MLLGALYVKPTLFDSPEIVSLGEADFGDTLQKVSFSIMSNLYTMGHSSFSSGAVESYIQGRPQLNKFYNEMVDLEDGSPRKQGEYYFEKLSETGDPTTFLPSFNTMKKMTLLRNLDKHGVNINPFYDWDATKTSIVEAQQNWLEKTDLRDIANEIADSIQAIMDGATSNATTRGLQAGEGLEELLESLKETPDFGSPSPIELMDSVTRGNRLGKYYLFSAPTGGGKSRIMMSMACNSALPFRYNQKKKEWIENGEAIPSLFISTELDESECQTMALAFMTGIQEEVILNGHYDEQDEIILHEAINIMKETPLYFEIITDFGISEVEATIRKHFRENNVAQFYFDYIHVSMKLLGEISSIASGTKLREDQIIFMLSAKLKDLANNLGIFIMSGTQLNGDYQEGELNQNLLRGGKSAADRIDVGIVATKIRPIDEASVQQFADQGLLRPNYVMSFYKVRRGKYAGTKLWCNIDLGTCSCKGLFLTDSNDVPIGIDRNTIKVKKAAEQRITNRNSFSVDQKKSAF